MKRPTRTRDPGSVGARRAYRDAYNAGQAGKPQPGSRKYQAKTAKGWKDGNEERQRNRQFSLLADQAERDAEFDRERAKLDAALRSAPMQHYDHGKRVPNHRERPEQQSLEPLEDGGGR